MLPKLAVLAPPLRAYTPTLFLIKYLNGSYWKNMLATQASPSSPLEGERIPAN